MSIDELKKVQENLEQAQEKLQLHLRPLMEQMEAVCKEHNFAIFLDVVSIEEQASGDNGPRLYTAGATLVQPFENGENPRRHQLLIRTAELIRDAANIRREVDHNKS